MWKTKKFARGRQFGKMIYLIYKCKKKSIDKSWYFLGDQGQNIQLYEIFFSLNYEITPITMFMSRYFLIYCKISTAFSPFAIRNFVSSSISWFARTKFCLFVNIVVSRFFLSNLCFAVKVHISLAYETKDNLCIQHAMHIAYPVRENVKKISQIIC